MTAKSMACGECGMLVKPSTRFHPFEYCVLVKAGQNPEELERRILKHYGHDPHPA